MSYPNRPDRKSPVSADTITRIIEEGEARSVGLSTPAGLVSQHGRGVLVRKRPSWMNTARRSGAFTPSPFDIYVNGTNAFFYAGTVNGYLPTNYLTGVTIVTSGTRYLVLNCTASNGQITAATISADVSQPGAIQPYKGQPPVSFKVLLGLTIDAVPYKVWGNGNIAADAIESFRIDKVSPLAGVMPYDIYYTWNLRLV